MTAEDRKLIFEYCGLAGWEDHHILGAADMVAAMNKIVEKVDWPEFKFFFLTKWDEDRFTFDGDDYFVYLMQPDRFFSLMADWLRGK